ncbi:MAG TPA: D-2-hydroxyacid dehydrogenase, partial [Tepidiformaceae bacterium]
MTGLLVSSRFLEANADRLAAVARGAGLELDPIVLPRDSEARLSPEDVDRIQIAFFSGDVFADGIGRAFFAAAQGAPNLKWLHVFNAGVDNPVFTRILEKGTRISTSSGSTAEPIAQTLIAGMLMLAREFPAWLDAQRRHAWEPLPRERTPSDLRGQTMVVVGLGAIGCEIARLARAFGLNVIGVRRSPLREGDPVDDVRPPSELPSLLPGCDWLALACPLTDETRRLVDAQAISLLPRGARILNIARGEVVDEPAMIEALRSGHLGGAYLDVVEQEPLPSDSPLWDLPNVIITPHNSAASTGNDARVLEYFFENLSRWGRGEPLVNEV